MKCTALFKSHICLAPCPQALSHDMLIADDSGEFMPTPDTNRCYMLAVEYDMLTSYHPTIYRYSCASMQT